MSKVYVITSGKGGVGKSTITANLAGKISEKGLRTLAIDMDTGLRNLDVIMGLENKVIYHLYDVLNDKCKIFQALVKGNSDNLYLLPTAQSVTKATIDKDKFYNLLCVLREYFDVILIDCPAGIDEGFMTSCEYADEAILVVNPIVTSIRDGDRVLGILNSNAITCDSVIVNMYHKHNKNVSIDVNDIRRILGVKDTYLFYYDEDVISCGNKGLSIFKSNRQSNEEYEKIADKIIASISIDENVKEE